MQLGALAPETSFWLPLLVDSGQFQGVPVGPALAELVDAGLVQEVQPRLEYRWAPLVQAYAEAQLTAGVAGTPVRLALFRYWLQLVRRGLAPPRATGALSYPRLVAAAWPQLTWAWPPVQALPPAVTAAEFRSWLELLGTWGCEYLGRRAAWPALVAWAAQLRAGYEQRYPAAVGTPLWGTLVSYEVLGQRQQGDWAAVAAGVARLSAVDLGAATALWRVRVALWQAWLRLAQGEPVTAAGRDRLGRAVAALAESSNPTPLGRQVAAEYYEWAGEAAARQGDAEQAERAWGRAAHRYLALWAGREPPGLSGTQRLVRRVAEWRAAHGLWAAAAELGTWELGLAVLAGADDTLAVAGTGLEWALRGGVGAVADRLAAYLMEQLAAGTAAATAGPAAALWLATWAAHREAWDVAQQWSAWAPAQGDRPAVGDWLTAVQTAVAHRRAPEFPPVAVQEPYRLPVAETATTLEPALQAWWERIRP